MSDNDGQRTSQAIVRWNHASGRGTAFCLARLILRSGPTRPVMVLTELAGNPDAVGLVSDVAGAVPAALDTLGAGVNPSSVVWLVQHGAFSSYDAAGAPETFTEVTVTFDGTRFHSDLPDQRLLSPAETEALRRDLVLAPVETVLADLQTAL